jgi:hypothetical protein
MFCAWNLLRCLFASRASLVAENLALRQQLAALCRKSPRPRLRLSDRLFWVALSRLFAGWRSWLVIVKPDTVVSWHKAGYRLSPAKPGRVAVGRERSRRSSE